jgi:S1-C subfamily serine protease
VNCPKCGTLNRANAKFCAQCRTPLTPVVTTKVCPKCAQPNRMGAKFCVGCGYTFATPAPPLISRRVLFGVGGAAIVVVLLVVVGLLSAGPGRSRRTAPGLTPLPAISAATPAVALPAATPASTLERALRATVQIIVPIDGERRSSGGSGSVLTEKGHILTNFHVVGDVKTGQLFNRKGVIYVAVSTPDLKGQPEERYIAELVQSDPGRDLALIKIRALRDGGMLPANLGLTTLPVGDSDTVNIGDALSIIGFPGLGGDTVTFTKGSVAGFLSAEGWIKTDAEINSGNSGGAAINSAGELVGIPSAAATSDTSAAETQVPGKIGLVRPVNLAKPLIEWAMEDARK